MSTTKLPSSLLFLTALSVVSMLILFVAYVWLFAEVHSTIDEGAHIAQEAQLAATRNAHTQTVRRVVRDTQQERAVLDTYFASEEDIVDFLEEFESIGSAAGTVFRVQSVSLGNTLDADERLIELTLTTQASGTFARVVHTLALLESFPKAARVDAVRIVENPETGEWLGTFDVVVVQIRDSEGVL